MIKVVFVCLGNICRSPLAEAIFKDKIVKKGIADHFEVASCGTANYHIGDSPDPRTIRNAIKNGVQINHRGRQLQETDLDYFEYIFVMDNSNYSNVLRLSNGKQNQHKVLKLRDYDTVVGDEVPDPYYGNEKDFQGVFEILNRSIDSVIDSFQQEHGIK